MLQTYLMKFYPPSCKAALLMSLFKKQRKPEKYLKLYHELFQQLKAILEIVVIRKHVISTFLSRYRVGMLAKQRNKKERKPKKTYRDDPMKWHSVTRERFICTGDNSDSGDPKWGRFLPSQMFNLDQQQCFSLPIQKKAYEIIEPRDCYQKT